MCSADRIKTKEEVKRELKDAARKARLLKRRKDKKWKPSKD